ncbi:MAG: glycoside hydrolase family protein [Rhodospirillaceae bacterium]|nr:glycoside hydrolase family protein [Rhodospirillaceae bacterium]
MRGLWSRIWPILLVKGVIVIIFLLFDIRSRVTVDAGAPPLATQAASGASHRKSVVLAADVIAHFEGLRTEPYRDGPGVSVCYGHQLSNSPSARLDHWESKTEQECRELLMSDVMRAYEAVHDSLDQSLTHHQSAALTSFVFNEGTGAWHRSTLRARVRAGDFSHVPAEFRRLVYSYGRRVEVLVRRREAEIELWLGRL